MISAFERSSEDRSCRLWSWIMKRLDRKLRACLYDPGTPRSRLVDNLLLFSQLCLYGDRNVQPDLVPGWSNWESRSRGTNACPYKRNIPVHGDEVNWNLKHWLTLGKTSKKPKQKETTFVGMLFICEQNLFSFYRQIIVNSSTIFLTK